MRKCDIPPDVSGAARVLQMSQSRSDCKKTKPCSCTFLADVCCVWNNCSVLEYQKRRCSSKVRDDVQAREGGQGGQYSKVAQREPCGDALVEGQPSEI